MIFRQYMEIIEGKKTQTRRVAKPSESYSDLRTEYNAPNARPYTVYDKHDRIKWQVGRTYAVVPKRGKLPVQIHKDGFTFEPERIQDGGYYESGYWYPFAECTPLRIRITAIRQERLQDISEDDAQSEGLKPIDGFGFMDEPVGPSDIITAREQYQELWQSINTRKGTRWDDNPSVWVLEFERV